MKIAFWLTSLGQVVVLGLQYPADPQWLVAAVLLAVGAALAWQIRQVLPVHADMFLIMTAFGGFGMVVGGFGQPTCHHSWAGTVGMLVCAVPPSLGFARCLQGSRRYWWLALDLAGMLGGMEMGHRLAGGANPWVMHLSMLVGMNAGMTLRLGFEELVRRLERRDVSLADGGF